MNPGTRRRSVCAIGTILVVVLGVGAWRAVQIVAIGVAYKSKTLCSGTFVSRRDSSAVLAELQADDLAILRYIGASVDAATQSVTASALGIVGRRTVYREGPGCVFILDGLAPPRLPAGSRVVVTPTTETVVGGALEAVIAGAFSEVHQNRPRRTLAVVVMHRGHVVGERCAAGIGPDTPLVGWSMIKRMMNALAGILVEQGHLTLVSSRVIRRPPHPRIERSLWRTFLVASSG